MKGNGFIRIYGDFKLTINQVAKADIYPIPNIDKIFIFVAGGKFFTKLDLLHTYQQLVLD